MRQISIIACTAVLLVAGCSVTTGVTLTMEDGSETFQGTETGYADGAGTLELISNRGLRCTGQWVFIDRPSYGQGTIQCTNGQSGPFEFVGTGRRGIGSGRLGDRPFTFTFG